MNILPTTTIFILLFALLSHSFVTHFKTTGIEETAYKAYLDADRRARTLVEKEAFNAFTKAHRKKAEPKKATATKETTTIPPFVNRRLTQGPIHESKLNLFTLMSEDKPPPRLKKVVLAYLTEIYGHRFAPNELSNFLEALQKTGRKKLDKAKKKSEEITYFEVYDLTSDDELSYLLLRGTNKYDIEAHIGYPPIEDILVFDKGGPPVLFYAASPTLLSSLFSPKIASKILQKESDKAQKNRQNYLLTKAELEELLNKERMNTQLLELLYFGKKKKFKSDLEIVKAEDDKTFITSSRKIM